MKKFSLQSGLILVEVLIIISLIGLIAAIVIPNYFRAREIAYHKSGCISTIHLIHAAKEQYARKNNLSKGTEVKMSDLPTVTNSVGNHPCPSGGTYYIGAIGELPVCSIHGHRLP